MTCMIVCKQMIQYPSPSSLFRISFHSPLQTSSPAASPFKCVTLFIHSRTSCLKCHKKNLQFSLWTSVASQKIGRTFTTNALGLSLPHAIYPLPDWRPCRCRSNMLHDGGATYHLISRAIWETNKCHRLCYIIVSQTSYISSMDAVALGKPAELSLNTFS